MDPFTIATFAQMFAGATDAMKDGTFDPVGSNWFNPDMFSNPSATVPGLPKISSIMEAGSVAGIPGITKVSAAPSAGRNANTQSLGVTVNNYFVRAIVIILGFIFVAIGLSMFKVVTLPGIPTK